MVKKKDSGESVWFKLFKWPFHVIFLAIMGLLILLWKFLKWLSFSIYYGLSRLLEKSKEKKEKVKDNNPDKKSHYVAFKTVKAINSTFEKFEDMLAKKDSTIGIILGARGSGKSAFGMKLLENLHANSDRKIYAMGFKTSELPSWIHTAENLDDISDGSYVLIDEGGILFNARQGFSDANQLLSKLLLVARHKDLSIMFISQNSSNLEINAIRQADYLVLKPSSLLQLDFERKKIKEIYEEALEDFKKYKNVKGLTYVYSDTFKGFVTNPLPTFWTTGISKSFRNKEDKK